MTPSFVVRTGHDAPVAAAALHDGHELRTEVRAIMALGDEERRREEDPFTAGWTTVVRTQLIGLRSRFEVDLNRPRAQAVYQRPEDAWGLNVWRESPSSAVVAASLAEYDALYAAARETFDDMRTRWGRFVVLDLHSYNHQRDGPTAAPSDAATNPEVNIGTSNMDRNRWAPVVDRAIEHLRTDAFMGRTLDVRENVKFKGGHFAHWIHDTYPEHGCAISIEFRKSFMDEWTGVPDEPHVRAVHDVLARLVPALAQALNGMSE